MKIEWLAEHVNHTAKYEYNKNEFEYWTIMLIQIKVN